MNSRFTSTCLVAFTLALIHTSVLAEPGPKPDPVLPPELMIVEGDIIIRVDSPAHRGTFTSSRWTNGVVPYEFSSNVSSSNRQLMLQAMDEWEAVATVSFRLRSGEANYIFIQSSSMNAAQVGMVGGRQEMYIYNWGTRFIIVHELGHALGLWHEQSRSDRDAFVRINTANICQNCCNGGSCNHNFEIVAGSGSNGPYDFDSVMHYGQYSFSANGQPTITVLSPNQAWQSAIGQRDHLSQGDIATMSSLYGGSTGTPPNDACGAARTISTGTHSGSNVGATTDSTASCASSGADVWWRFCPSSTSRYSIDTNGSNFDTVLSLRTSCATTDFQCDDDGGDGNASLIEADLTAGTCYLIRVAGFGSSTPSTGAISLRISGASTTGACCIGGGCSQRAEADCTAQGGTYHGDNTQCASETCSTSSCASCPNYDSVLNSITTAWQTDSKSFSSGTCHVYRLSLQAGRSYTLKTGCGDGATATFDTVVTVFKPDCSQLAEDDDGCAGLLSRVAFTAASSGIHFVRVRHYSGGGGDFTLAYRQDGGSDSDGDGVPDSTDNCPSTPNASQANCDGDNQGDACDSDDDNDGDPDLSDCDDCNPNRRHGASENCSDGVDNDCDGVIDGNDSDCRPADADGDGIPDSTDNCPGTPNASQANCDSDSQGDACDTDDDNDGDPDSSDCDDCNPHRRHGASETCSDGADNDCDGAIDGNDSDCRPADADGDGVPDSADNCPSTPNADQANCDGDNQGDACDSDDDNDGDPDSSDCDDCNSSRRHGASENCSDGVDNNCDGAVDCYDSGCSETSGCSGSGVCGVSIAQASLASLLFLGFVRNRSVRRRCPARTTPLSSRRY